MEKILMQKFQALCNRLSPENLCCDGEISKSQVARRLADIKREWKVLERQAGRKVSQEEIENEQIQSLWRNAGIAESKVKEWSGTI